MTAAGSPPLMHTTSVLLSPAETPALSVRAHWTIRVKVPGESTGGTLQRAWPGSVAGVDSLRPTDLPECEV